MTDDTFCVYTCATPFNTIFQYLFPRFRLAFSPTLYKFIVRAFWAWIHSYFGFKSKPVLTYTKWFYPLVNFILEWYSCSLNDSNNIFTLGLILFSSFFWDTYSWVNSKLQFYPLVNFSIAKWDVYNLGWKY